MALSGTISNTVATGYKLQLEWSATQDIANNQSTITAKLYWMSLGSSYTVNSSATKTSGIQHDDGAFSTESSSGMADLSANQKKLINTYQFTITHNSDGTKSFSLDGYFDCEVSLGGSYYSTINLTQTTFTLNTIPRASTLTGGDNWTAGGATTFTIDRKSTSFTHDIAVYVSGDGGTTYTLIQTITGVGTSYTWTPNDADMTAIFDKLNNSSGDNQPTKIITTTKDSGGNAIGTDTEYGTVTAPTASTTASPASFTVGGSFTTTITRKYSNLIHTVKLKNGTEIYKTWTNVGTSLVINTTALSDDGVKSIATRIYEDTTTVPSKVLTIEITTYYDSATTDQQVRDPLTESITANISGNPTFTTITYIDNDTTIAAKTNPYKGTNNPYIIQGKSKLQAKVLNASKAQAQNLANITKYIATFNGVAITKNSPFATDILFDFNQITADKNGTLSIVAYDSRGFSTEAKIIVNVVAWAKPTITATADRTDGFSSEVLLKLTGALSPVNVNGTKINSLVPATCNYKWALSGGVYSADTSFTNLVLNPTTFAYSADNATVNGTTGLDNTKSYIVHVKITDQFDFYEVDIIVPTGKPIFMIDGLLKSIGFGDFPTQAGEFLMNGTMRFAGNKWGSTGGAIDMGNGDIIKANAMWFNDDANSGTEGFMFAKAGITAGSVTASDYYNFRIDKDGKILIDGGATRFISGQPMTIQGGDTTMLKLIATDHGYIEWFNDGTGASRAAWLGFGSAGTTLLTLRNDKGDISITPVATTNKINLNGDCYISNGVGLTIGTAGSANTANQLYIYNTGDAINLQSGNNADAYNAGNIAWRTSGGVMVGRMHVNGTSYATSTMQFEVTDETGSGAPDLVLELNAAGGNWAKVNGDLLPQSDNFRNLGTTSFRWKQLFAGTTTISTSDEKTKQQISLVPDEWLDAWSDVDYVQFKFNDAVAEKGESKARWHIGIIAQSIEKAFKKHGLDAFKIGILCYDEWTDNDGISHNLYGIRPDECQFMELALMRRELNKLKGVS